MLTDSPVIVGEELTELKTETKLNPKMKSMNVVSTIRNRYARTVVTSKYVNLETSAQEATFSIVLPDTAFIAGFVMEIKGKNYEAYVKEKQEAKQEYQQAVSSGRAAAHVAVSARDSNKFTVSVNVEPQSDVTFILTYEELLVRKHSKYEMVVNLHPGQLLDDLGVDIHINETRPITYVETPALRSGNKITTKVTKNELASIIKYSNEVVHISFHPTIEQQIKMAEALSNIDDKEGTSKELLNKGKYDGISGQFVVEYDVERDPLGGEVLVNNGYFVHFFSPTKLKPIPKHVIFVLDVSLSMEGRKLDQLKEAMKAILNELNSEDYFNIVKFSSFISVLTSEHTWEKLDHPTESKLPQSFPVNVENINLVKDVVDQMQVEFSTNIYDALIVGLRLTSKGISHLEKSGKKYKPQPMIVFLTDGQPTCSESDPEIIIEMVEKRNDCNNKSAIFTLAFGNDADNEFLKELAIQNSGFLRRIYEAADASLQLQDFYKQISSPLLTNVNFKYPKEAKEVTNHTFDILFDGSEFVVAGQADEMVDGFVFVEGSTLDGTNKFCPTINTIASNPEVKEEYGSLERLWAYMTIKQLLDKKYEKKASEKGTSGRPKEETAESLALKLALKYSFVTPVTSLVVVKPDEPAIEQTKKEKQQALINDIRNLMMANTSSILSRDAKLCDLDCRADALQNTYSEYEEKTLKYCSKSRFSLEMKVKSFSEVKGVLLKKGSKIVQFFTKSKDNKETKQVALESIKVDYNVKNHVANILETRKYVNFDDKPQETTFTIVLPDKTLFVEFVMVTEGQKFIANGQNKEQAKKEYEDAVSRGVNTALVNLETSNKVNATFHIEPRSEVMFILKYKKHLQVHNNKYEIVINLAHEAIIYEMAVDVFINEISLIKNIQTPPLRFKNKTIENKYAIITKFNDNEALISFHPTTKQQEEIIGALKSSDEYVSGQFVVEYEVEKEEYVPEDTATNISTTTPFSHFVAVKF